MPVSLPKKKFEKEHKHLVKVLKKGSKKEGEEQEKELESEKSKSIHGVKSTAIVDKKDNYEKSPSKKLKKKRSTSEGYMVR